MMFSGQLNIGPIAFDLLTAGGTGLAYVDKAYQGFWRVGSTSGDQPLTTLPVRVVWKAMPVPPGQPLYEAGKNWALWQEGDQLVACSGFYGQAAAQYTCRVDRAMTAAEMFIDPARPGCEAPLRYPLDQFLSWGLLGRCGGIILHAAVAVKDGVGWVFTGRSGAGKSTISGLCHAAGWQILNDDRVILYVRDGVVRVAGTPWHGSGRFAEDAEVDLGAVFFLHQSPDDRVELVPASAARLMMLDTAAIPWFDDAWLSGALAAVEKLSMSATFYHLYFTRTPAAVSEIERVISGVLQDLR